MRELDVCLNIRKQINDVDEKIEELKAVATSPSGQVISDMPRSGRIGNAIEDYIIKLEKLETRKYRLEQLLKEKWSNAYKILHNSNVPLKNIKLLYCRYAKGLSWKECVKRMRELYPNELWNENKVFRLNRQALSKVTKKM